MTEDVKPSLISHEDGLTRCSWCGTDPLYTAYHDTDWGVPEYDDRALWEKLILDGFQAGLSWITILRKREAFREAFDGFDPEKIASYGDAKIEELMNNKGIVRNRAKITSSVRNAQIWIDIMGQQGFSNYLWDYVGGAPIQNTINSMSDIPAETEISKALSKDLKQRGFNFCGPTIVYAFMQAVGIVNDHLVGCHCRERVAALGSAR